MAAIIQSRLYAMSLVWQPTHFQAGNILRQRRPADNELWQRILSILSNSVMHKQQRTCAVSGSLCVRTCQHAHAMDDASVQAVLSGAASGARAINTGHAPASASAPALNAGCANVPASAAVGAVLMLLEPAYGLKQGTRQSAALGQQLHEQRQRSIVEHPLEPRCQLL